MCTKVNTTQSSTEFRESHCWFDVSVRMAWLRQHISYNKQIVVTKALCELALILHNSAEIELDYKDLIQIKMI